MKSNELVHVRLYFLFAAFFFPIVHIGPIRTTAPFYQAAFPPSREVLDVDHRCCMLLTSFRRLVRVHAPISINNLGET